MMSIGKLLGWMAMRLQNLPWHLPWHLKNQCLRGSIQLCSLKGRVSQDFSRLLSPCSHHGYLGILPRDPQTQNDALSLEVAPWGLYPEAAQLQKSNFQPWVGWFLNIGEKHSTSENPGQQPDLAISLASQVWTDFGRLAFCPQPFSKSHSFVAKIVWT